MRNISYESPTYPVIKSIRWQGGKTNIQIHRMDANGQILFGLRLQQSWLVKEVVQDWSRYFDKHPEMIPNPGCFWISNIGTTKGLGNSLAQSYVIRPTGRSLSYGPFTYLATEWYFIGRFREFVQHPMQLELEIS